MVLRDHLDSPIAILAQVLVLNQLAMLSFSANRLEGRALEHELAEQAGLHIRMKTEGGSWVLVRGGEAAKIRKTMRLRVAELVSDLKRLGLHKRRADCPVSFATATGVKKKTKSVDLILWDANREAEILVEVKWTRGCLATALRAAEKSFSWMRVTCERGRWQSSRKLVQATLVGALVVARASWWLRVETAGGRSVAMHTSKEAVLTMPAKRASGRSRTSGWARWKAKGGRPSGPNGASNWSGFNAARKAARVVKKKAKRRC